MKHQAKATCSGRIHTGGTDESGVNPAPHRGKLCAAAAGGGCIRTSRLKRHLPRDVESSVTWCRSRGLSQDMGPGSHTLIQGPDPQTQIQNTQKPQTQIRAAVVLEKASAAGVREKRSSSAKTSPQISTPHTLTIEHLKAGHTASVSGAACESTSRRAQEKRARSRDAGSVRAT